MTETTPVSTILRKIAPIQIAAWRLMMEKHQDFIVRFSADFRDRHDLTVNEFDALINTPPDEQIRQRDLLQLMVLSRSALSRLLRRLEARSLVTQTPDPEDQRGVLVELTEKGVALRDEAAQTNAAIILDGFSGLSDAEADQLFGLVSKLKPLKPLAAAPE
ncbi:MULTISPECIES: MarR family transcriptional regulator [unclassified Brevibacterium]|uniref:MarR family winged helix-turn-helix transcriptional regulator n=1 Tax=unclassified Brevibacterium TaxID=2614124 RepID=UPI0010F5C908|nr:MULTISPECIES: MarR family transcriptional regulator [unclassified Brevibacterium]MCM1013062.1 MarR family transcriptional regulator [Brevibacterium sp. XM4083]